MSSMSNFFSDAIRHGFIVMEVGWRSRSRAPARTKATHIVIKCKPELRLLCVVSLLFISGAPFSLGDFLAPRLPLWPEGRRSSHAGHLCILHSGTRYADDQNHVHVQVLVVLVKITSQRRRFYFGYLTKVSFCWRQSFAMVFTCTNAAAAAIAYFVCVRCAFFNRLQLRRLLFSSRSAWSRPTRCCRSSSASATRSRCAPSARCATRSACSMSTPSKRCSTTVPASPRTASASAQRHASRRYQSASV